MAEIRQGNPEAAKKRLQIARRIPLLEIDEDTREFARRLVKSGAVPEKAAEDAVHIAVATVHKMNYLLTWNCRHIANAERRGQITAVSEVHGLKSPTICTPEQLMGINDVDG